MNKLINGICLSVLACIQAMAMDVNQKPQDKSLIPAEWAGKTVGELIQAGLIPKRYEWATVSGKKIRKLVEAGIIPESPQDSTYKMLGKQLVEAVRSNNSEAVRKLIADGADIDYEATIGDTTMTPLKAAAQRNHKAIACLLIAAKADLDDQSWADDKTALAHAAQMGNQDIVHLLLEAGADVTITDRSRERNTALQHALLSSYQPQPEIKFAICQEIIEKMLYVPNQEQLKRLFIFECCLQRTFIKDIRNLIKASLPGIIAQENREQFEESYACGEIYRMKYSGSQERLLDTNIPDRKIKRIREKYFDLKLEEYLAKTTDIRHCPTNWCKFRYALETPAADNGNWIYRWIFGEPVSQSPETFECPNCKASILINQPKTTKPWLFDQNK